MVNPEKKSEEKGGILAMIKKIWLKAGLDRHTIELMIKAAIPPTISLAIYQATPVADVYGTVGYLIPIVSIVGTSFLPRAKFIQTLIFNLLFVCVAACLSLLMVYTAVKARQNTESTTKSSSVGSPVPGVQTFTYNSSASAVCAIWLFFEIYLVNSVRAKLPQFTSPTIAYCIFINVAAVYAPQFGTVAQGVSFVNHLLWAFLAGLAVTTGTAFLIFPTTSRQIVFKQMTGYIGALRKTLRAHAAYFESIERNDMFGRTETKDNRREKRGKNGEKIYSPEADAIKTAVRMIIELHGNLHADLVFAKREAAVGNLGPDDLKEIFTRLRSVMIPVVGLGSIVDIFERLSDFNKWNEPNDDPGPPAAHSDATRKQVVHEWNDLMRAVHEPFACMIEAMDEGLQHVLYRFRLAKRPRNHANTALVNATQDVEATSAAVNPGDDGFADYLEKKTKEFNKGKQVALRAWCDEKGIELPPDFFEHPEMSVEIPEFTDTAWMGHGHHQRQLCILLYMEHMLYSTGQAVLEFVRFADERAASGKLSTRRLIIPGSKRLQKWILSSFQAQDSQQDDNAAQINSPNVTVNLGEAYRTRKDPEHLPAETAMQKIGDRIRLIPAFLRSAESTFGFRVSCATMCIAIIAFLEPTQGFFAKQRLVWAMIMITISMTPTAGQSIFSFVARVLGTIVAMVTSLLIWYIPDGKTPGIIVFMFLFIAAIFYIFFKYPRFIVMVMICAITIALIIGYELEARKIGEEAADSNGQDYYPIYLLAPYRLATVIVGLFVAFFWTVFPYPISEHSVLRQSLGASLYLLAKYYSIVHETVSARIRGDEGDMTLKMSVGRRLEKERHSVYSKQALMLNKLRTYSAFLKWEVPLGGRFPQRHYDVIIVCMQNIVNYVSLVEYVSRMFTASDSDGDNSDTVWLRDFKRLMASAYLTTHEITSLLALLSASISNSQPLPPYLKTPRPYGFIERLRELDKDILSLRHCNEPGYAAFSVLQVSTRCIIGDLEKLIKNVKALVGELDFSFQVVSTNNSAESLSPSASFLGMDKGDRD